MTLPAWLQTPEGQQIIAELVANPPTAFKDWRTDGCGMDFTYRGSAMGPLRKLWKQACQVALDHGDAWGDYEPFRAIAGHGPDDIVAELLRLVPVEQLSPTRIAA